MNNSDLTLREISQLETQLVPYRERQAQLARLVMQYPNDIPLRNQLAIVRNDIGLLEQRLNRMIELRMNPVAESVFWNRVLTRNYGSFQERPNLVQVQQYPLYPAPSPVQMPMLQTPGRISPFSPIRSPRSRSRSSGFSSPMDLSMSRTPSPRTPVMTPQRVRTIQVPRRPIAPERRGLRLQQPGSPRPTPNRQLFQDMMTPRTVRRASARRVRSPRSARRRRQEARPAARELFASDSDSL
jgi:hypothetical protein